MQNLQEKAPFRYRPVELRDNLRLATIIRDVFREFDAPRKGTVFSDPSTDNLYALFQQPGSSLWVVEIGGVVEGSCGVFPTTGLPEGYAELVKFYLAPDARGRGTGRRLMEKTIESARSLGYSHLYLESLPVFSHAVAMYHKAGFITLDHQLGESGHSSCDVWMVKSL